MSKCTAKGEAEQERGFVIRDVGTSSEANDLTFIES